MLNSKDYKDLFLQFIATKEFIAKNNKQMSIGEIEIGEAGFHSEIGPYVAVPNGFDELVELLGCEEKQAYTYCFITKRYTLFYYFVHNDVKYLAHRIHVEKEELPEGIEKWRGAPYV